MDIWLQKYDPKFENLTLNLKNLTQVWEFNPKFENLGTKYEKFDPKFENLSLNIGSSDKITLVGKNGTGKSTLMNIISQNKTTNK